MRVKSVMIYLINGSDKSKRYYPSLGAQLGICHLAVFSPVIAH